MQKWDSRDSGTESAGEDTWETTRQDDYIRVPKAPGLGVEIDEDVVRDYALKGEPFFEEE
jgi:L-alanine-DL-glutamate epimerase-like enolase superfamily enzyme